MPGRLRIHCPPGVPAKDVHRLGRVARLPGFGGANLVLGWVVLAGQFVAIGVVLSWVFVPLLMFSDFLVVRIIEGVLTAWVLWGAYRLVEGGVRLAWRERVVHLELFVWAAGLVLMLLVSVMVSVEVV